MADTSCASKNSQVSEQRARVNALMKSLTEEIGRAEQRLSTCLRQEPVNPSGMQGKLQEQKVELASWLMGIAEDLEIKISMITSIINRCEL